LAAADGCNNQQIVRALLIGLDQAPELAAQGERVLSTDVLTSVQALERTQRNLPLAPGYVERREF
jgi:hypothetical protein